MRCLEYSASMTSNRLPRLLREDTAKWNDRIRRTGWSPTDVSTVLLRDHPTHMSPDCCRFRRVPGDGKDDAVTAQDDTNVTLTLDLRGLLCPIPVVKISKAIKGVEVGQMVEATATDPGVMVDIPAWCRSTGNELVSLDKVDRGFVFRVRRSG